MTDQLTSVTRSSSDKPRVLLGLTGSVATIKAIELVTHMQKFAEVRVIVSNKALHFVDILQLRQICQVYTDEDEWRSTRWQRGDEVLHIELRKWASLFLIAPLSANSLSLLATGGCPSLLLCVARAWDFPFDQSLTPSTNQTMSTSQKSDLSTYQLTDQSCNSLSLALTPSTNQTMSTNQQSGLSTYQLTDQSCNQASNRAIDLAINQTINQPIDRFHFKPLVLAPAMNVAMYQHPITCRQIADVKSFGPNVHVIDPISKMLACGDIGKGAMAEPIDIARHVETLLAPLTESSFI